jgi:type II secretory pathway pseudopilin PulG
MSPAPANPCTRARAFTLVEALVATVIVAMVSSAAAMSVAVGVAVQEQNRLSVLAMHAAELQMTVAMETSYDLLPTIASTEAKGHLLAPARPGSSVRPELPAGFSQLSRTTTVTTENRLFSQYQNYLMSGYRIEVSVFGPDGTLLAKLKRYRPKDPTS